MAENLALGNTGSAPDDWEVPCDELPVEWTSRPWKTPECLGLSSLKLGYLGIWVPGRRQNLGHSGTFS